MSYRNPDRARMQQQMDAAHFPFAGQTATWRRFEGSAAGVAVAGIGGSARYRESVITALFGKVQQMEMQQAAGMVAASTITCTTHEQLGRQDELMWRGVIYRVESDPVRVPMGDMWLCTLKRGK